MGISSDGIIAYGYDIGSDENELWWADDDDDKPAWHVEETIEYNGMIDTMEQFLLKQSGFVEDRGDDGWYARRKKASDNLGIGIVHHCSSDYPMYLLIVNNSFAQAYRGSPKEISLDHFVVEDWWNERLKWALDTLGLTSEKEPAWYLASYLG